MFFYLFGGRLYHDDRPPKVSSNYKRLEFWLLVLPFRAVWSRSCVTKLTHKYPPFALKFEHLRLASFTIWPNKTPFLTS